MIQILVSPYFHYMAFTDCLHHKAGTKYCLHLVLTAKEDEEDLDYSCLNLEVFTLVHLQKNLEVLKKLNTIVTSMKKPDLEFKLE